MNRKVSIHLALPCCISRHRSFRSHKQTHGRWQPQDCDRSGHDGCLPVTRPPSTAPEIVRCAIAWTCRTRELRLQTVRLLSSVESRKAEVSGAVRFTKLLALPSRYQVVASAWRLRRVTSPLAPADSPFVALPVAWVSASPCSEPDTKGAFARWAPSLTSHHFRGASGPIRIAANCSQPNRRIILQGSQIDSSHQRPAPCVAIAKGRAYLYCSPKGNRTCHEFGPSVGAIRSHLATIMPGAGLRNSASSNSIGSAGAKRCPWN